MMCLFKLRHQLLKVTNQILLQSVLESRSSFEFVLKFAQTQLSMNCTDCLDWDEINPLRVLFVDSTLLEGLGHIIGDYIDGQI